MTYCSGLHDESRRNVRMRRSSGFGERSPTRFLSRSPGSHTILLLLCKTCKIYIFVSGAEGIRTPDLRRAKAALSQLSYGPRRAWMVEFTAVGQRGLQRVALILTRTHHACTIGRE